LLDSVFSPQLFYVSAIKIATANAVRLKLLRLKANGGKRAFYSYAESVHK
jgi:hypothetical protein